MAKIPAALRSLDQPSIDGINTWVVSGGDGGRGFEGGIVGAWRR
jgi:hypothetical protein